MPICTSLLSKTLCVHAYLRNRNMLQEHCTHTTQHKQASTLTKKARRKRSQKANTDIHKSGGACARLCEQACCPSKHTRKKDGYVALRAHAYLHQLAVQASTPERKDGYVAVSAHAYVHKLAVQAARVPQRIRQSKQAQGASTASKRARKQVQHSRQASKQAKKQASKLAKSTRKGPAGGGGANVYVHAYIYICMYLIKKLPIRGNFTPNFPN